MEQDRTHPLQIRPSWRDGTRSMSCYGCARRLSSRNLLACLQLKNGCMFMSSHNLGHSASPQQRLTLSLPSTGPNLTQRPRPSKETPVILITPPRRLRIEGPASLKLVISPVALTRVGLSLRLSTNRLLANLIPMIDLANTQCDIVQKTSFLALQKLPLRHHELVGSVKGRSI